MLRLRESWYLWVLVDLIYVPLYASRGLYVTAGVYAILLVLAYGGLRKFQAAYLINQAAAASG